MGNKSVLIKRRVRINIGVAMLAAIALVATLSSQTYAQSASTSTSTTTAATTANVLKVSPLRSDISIAAGSSKTVQITVINPTSNAINVSPIENDFTSGDEAGTPAIILDANTFAPTHSLKRFMTKVPDVVVPAGGSKTISVLITVPRTAQAGGYFGAIRLAPTDPDTGGQVNLSANVASIILLTVPGALTEKLNLTNFEIQQNGKSSSSVFRTPDNIEAYIRFENKGNVQTGPFGKISVKQGSKVVYEADFNTKDPRDVILPDGARRWSVPLKSIGKFGHYTVSATLTYGQNNQTVQVTKSFWVIPMYIIIAAIAAVVIVIGIIVGVILYLRSSRHARRRGRGRRRY